MYVNVVFVVRCLYSAVRLSLVREQRFTGIIIIIITYRTSCDFLIDDFKFSRIFTHTKFPKQ